ncbi:MAG: hypothetical protein GXP24_10120 [Planctomycetes bacterium]|nr:hypothetical protein [Planctomycetota bacterium]
MITESQNLLASFHALPITEQQVVAAEILRQVSGTKSSPTDDNDLLASDAWVQEFDQWARQHRLRNAAVDDSRDSIYRDGDE